MEKGKKQKLKNSMLDGPFDFCGLSKKCGFTTFPKYSQSHVNLNVKK